MDTGGYAICYTVGQQVNEPEFCNHVDNYWVVPVNQPCPVPGRTGYLVPTPIKYECDDRVGIT